MTNKLKNSLKYIAHTTYYVAAIDNFNVVHRGILTGNYSRFGHLYSH